jgi:putative transposase
MIGSSGRWPIWDMRSQTVGNVLRRHGIPPAPERKRRTTWAGIIRILLALLAGTDISAAEVLMRGLVTCYVLFSIYLESSRIDISRITNCPNKPWTLRVTRNVGIRGCGTRQRCYALQDRDTIYFTSFQAPRARPERSVSVGAERSMVAPANECLSKVIFFGDRSSYRMTTSHTERNHQASSALCAQALGVRVTSNGMTHRPQYRQGTAEASGRMAANGDA